MSSSNGKPQDAARGAEEFVRTLLSPKAPLGAYRELGTTALARQLGLPEEQLSGHWCSRCQAIWYGCLLEVQCPACGNRSG
jgi:hypothetical protein